MKGEKYHDFIFKLDNEAKDECILFILDLLEKGVSIKEVYEGYIIPALAEYECNSEIEEICIWKEHARTSIIRTILEATYPYLIKQKKNRINKNIIVACPQLEYHEIGAILAANFFTLEGFDAKYIGANTPSEQIVSAVKIIKPDFVALSITNYYNMVSVKKLTEKLKIDFPEVKLILGGQATKNDATLNQLQYDYIIENHEDIIKFKEGLK
jgi:methanogenic corrinoid protein MtbC1